MVGTSTLARSKTTSDMGSDLTSTQLVESMRGNGLWVSGMERGSSLSLRGRSL